MKLVGITGGIASGKTTVRKIFEKMGAESLDADAICHEKIGELKEELVREFGPSILKRNEVDREKLREITLQNNKLRIKLEKILHPYVREEILKISKEERKGITVCEVPLLFEVGWENLFDEIVVIKRCKEKRLESLLRKGLSEKEAKKLMEVQLPESIKEKLAHYVIDNQGNLSKTSLQAKKLWKRWLKEEKSL